MARCIPRGSRIRHPALILAGVPPRAGAAPRPARQTVFLCDSAQQPAPRPPPRVVVTDDPPGRLEVVALPPSEPQPQAEAGAAGSGENTKQPVARREVSVVAENVTLGALALALAGARDTNVWVEPQLIQARVSMVSRGMAAHEVLESIGRQLQIHVSLWPDWLIFESEQAAFDFRRRCESLMPLKVRAIELNGTVSGPGLAELYCRVLASERGAVAVLGNWVFVKDHVEGLGRFEGMARRVKAISPEWEAEHTPPATSVRGGEARTGASAQGSE